MLDRRSTGLRSLVLAACLTCGVGLAEDSADRSGKPLYGGWGFDLAGALAMAARA